MREKKYCCSVKQVIKHHRTAQHSKSKNISLSFINKDKNTPEDARNMGLIINLVGEYQRTFDKITAKLVKTPFWRMPAPMLKSLEVGISVIYRIVNFFNLYFQKYKDSNIVVKFPGITDLYYKIIMSEPDKTVQSSFVLDEFDVQKDTNAVSDAENRVEDMKVGCIESLYNIIREALNMGCYTPQYIKHEVTRSFILEIFYQTKCDSVKVQDLCKNFLISLYTQHVTMRAAIIEVAIDGIVESILMGHHSVGIKETLTIIYSILQFDKALTTTMSKGKWAMSRQFINVLTHLVIVDDYNLFLSDLSLCLKLLIRVNKTYKYDVLDKLTRRLSVAIPKALINTMILINDILDDYVSDTIGIQSCSYDSKLFSVFTCLAKRLIFLISDENYIVASMAVDIVGTKAMYNFIMAGTNVRLLDLLGRELRNTILAHWSVSLRGELDMLRMYYFPLSKLKKHKASSASNAINDVYSGYWASIMRTVIKSNKEWALPYIDQFKESAYVCIGTKMRGHLEGQSYKHMKRARSTGFILTVKDSQVPCRLLKNSRSFT